MEAKVLMSGVWSVSGIFGRYHRGSWWTVGCSRPGSVVFAQLDDQIDDDARIQNQESDPRWTSLLEDFVELEGDQRAGGEDDEVSRPIAFENQSDPLDQVKYGIKEGASLDGPEARPIDARKRGDDAVDQVIVGVEPEMGARFARGEGRGRGRSSVRNPGRVSVRPGR